MSIGYFMDITFVVNLIILWLFISNIYLLFYGQYLNLKLTCDKYLQENEFSTKKGEEIVRVKIVACVMTVATTYFVSTWSLCDEHYGDEVLCLHVVADW